MGRFSKTAKIHQQMSTSCDFTPYNSAMLTDCPKLTTKIAMGCLVSIFTVIINSKSFPGLYALYNETNPNFRQRPILGKPHTLLCCLVD